VYYVSVGQGLTSPAAATVRRALNEAEAAGATALIVEVQGGGSLTDAWTLAREIAEAQVPVVTYVAPRNAEGGAVGTLLIAASHVAAMAPGARIGFAAPLVDVPSGFTSTTQQLLVDDAVQRLNQWSRDHNRNAAWFEQALRNGAIIDAEAAQQLQPPVIDLVATDDDLLTTLQGRRVTLANGEDRTLQTLGAQVRRIEPSPFEALGQLLAIPTVAFVLFVLGGIGLYLELATPGVGIPGVTGALLIIAALVGFALAEVRPLAVLLLAAGLIVVGLEHVASSHGGFTLAGVVLLVLGALYLVDPARSPGLQVSYVAIGGVALGLTGAAVALLTLAMRVRTQRPSTGQESLIGQLAEVRQPIAPEGMVFVHGALWSAWTEDDPIAVGEFVEIVSVEGLRLQVRRLRET
jgi:membrane-bound serine protease (ClpP class)